MRSLAVVVFACAGVLGIVGSLAFVHHPKSAARVVMPQRSKPVPVVSPEASGEPLPREPLRTTFPALPALRFSNQNTGESATVRLYDDGGHVDLHEAERLDALLCDSRDPKSRATATLDRRTLQLAVRAALHFHVSDVIVVSAYRKPGRRAEGPHASGRALDFKLPAVPPRVLAAYLRTMPRVGVGIYTHPRTAFVHLDDREHSFHWLDASPPGRHWREMSIGGAGLAKRDASYARADDWPEGTTPPTDGTL